MNALRALSVARFSRDQNGATVVEFALLVAPFLFLLMGIMEVSVQYFVSTAFESALQRTARLVRTGQAQTLNMGVDDLKASLCDDILNLFDCTSNSYLTIDEINALTIPRSAPPINADGSFIAARPLDLGVGGSYVVVRGYFQFAPLFNVFGALYPHLDNGKRLIGTSALFRNEPF